VSNQILRNSLRERRQAVNLSIDELAELAGVGRTTIGAIERDGQIPSGTVQLKLAIALDSTVQDLFWSEPVQALAS
jgi:putative transcriptional regulator